MKQVYNFIDVLTKTQSEMMELLPEILSSYGYQVTVTDYMVKAISPLKNQVCLVAHLDTINTKDYGTGFGKYGYMYTKTELTEKEKTPTVKDILVTEKYILLSPEHNENIDCLGADDRVGVKTILDILSMGLRPHILFTTDEEIGCVGSRKAVDENSLEELRDASMLIQIDRGVHEDSWHEMVTYSFEPNSHPEIFEELGKTFTMATGSYTDVAVLGSYLNKPIVNVSASYKNEHHTDEFINLEAYDYNTKGLIKFIKWAIKQDTSDWKYVAKYVPKPKPVTTDTGYAGAKFLKVPSLGEKRISLYEENGDFVTAEEYLDAMNQSPLNSPISIYNSFIKAGYTEDELLCYLDEAYEMGATFKSYPELSYILKGYLVPDTFDDSEV